MELSTIFPITELVVGDTWDILISLDTYPATSWYLTYILKKATTNPISITSVANGLNHELKVSKTTTSTYSAGTYQAVAFITNLSDASRYTLGSTSIVLDPDLSVSNQAFDPRSPNQIILDQIDAALALVNTTGSPVVEYTIGSRTIKYNKTELLKMRQLYAMKVRRDNGIQQGNIIRYGFAPTTWRF